MTEQFFKREDVFRSIARFNASAYGGRASSFLTDTPWEGEEGEGGGIYMLENARTSLNHGNVQETPFCSHSSNAFHSLLLRVVPLSIGGN